eukprot:gene8625-10615_t
MTINTIALDLGGVVFSAVSEPSMELRKGTISDDQFWNGYVKSKVPSHYDVDKIKSIYYQGYIIDEDIVAVMKKFTEKGYKLVAFSGNIPSRIEYLDKKYQFRRLFNLEVYSFDCGATKPDPYFIEVLIKKSFSSDIEIQHEKRPTGEQMERLKQLGEQILYLDDNPHDAAPAAQYNINTFIYERGHIDKFLNQLSSKYQINL